MTRAEYYKQLINEANPSDLPYLLEGISVSIQNVCYNDFKNTKRCYQKRYRDINGGCNNCRRDWLKEEV